MGLLKIVTGLGIQRFLNLAAADDADDRGTPLVPLVAGMSAGAEGLTATIALGASVSDAIDVRGRWIGGFDLAAGFDGAALIFNRSRDGVAWKPVKDRFGTALRYDAAAGDFVNADPRDFAAVHYLQLVAADANGDPVDQAATATEIMIEVVV